MTDLSRHRAKIADLTDHFAIRNFVLSDTSVIPKDQSFEEPFIFNGFFFVICLKGESVIKLNFREYVIRRDMIFTYLPGQIFQLVRKSDDFLIEALFLSGDYVIQLPLPKDFDLLKMVAREPVRQADREALHNMLELHALVSKYHRREDNRNRDPQTKALLFALLMEVGSVYPAAKIEIPNAVSRQELLTDDFFKLLLEYFKTERGVAFYADKMCLTPKYLSMTVKKITGNPISEWINRAVIIEAKRMLKATDMTALQISEELNFPNPSFFGRFFKQYAGMTPLQYKNS